MGNFALSDPCKMLGRGGRNACVILTVQPKIRAGAYHRDDSSRGGGKAPSRGDRAPYGRCKGRVTGRKS